MSEPLTIGGCTLHLGDCRTVLAGLPAESVDCIVTSPPYWQKRDYGAEGQLGAEPTPEQYVETLVAIGGDLRRVLRPLGSLWINVADSYAAAAVAAGGSLSRNRAQLRSVIGRRGWRKAPPGYKDKDLALVSAAVAEGLREDGWFLRKTIIWAKPRAAEPPRQDRPAVSHEYVFLLTKRNDSGVRDPGEGWWNSSVWMIPPASVPWHPAPMATELAERCIKAGCPQDGIVLDPFAGAGTTGLVAERLQRRSILVELNPAYRDMAAERIRRDAPLLALGDAA